MLFTSVLIVAPLLWEASQRLKVMPPDVAAAVLTAFALVSIGLAAYWAKGVIATVACTAAVAMSFALLIARDDIVPFTAGLLIIAAAAEFTVWRDNPTLARAIGAVSADLVVLLFTWLMSRNQGMPDTWVVASAASIAAAQISLALIYITTAVIQSVFKRRTLSFPEMIQTAAALLIGIGGAVWIFRDQRSFLLVLGLGALAAGLVSYAISFLLFEHENKWNFRAWATFGLFLSTLGMYLPFSRTGFWILSCVCALICCSVARRYGLPTLGLHGAVFLGLGSSVAGATLQSLEALFNGATASFDWVVAMAVAAAAGAAWIGIAGIPSNGHGNWRNQISSLLVAGHISWIAAAVVASAIGSAAGVRAPADTIGTVAIVGIAIGLAWSGMRWARREFIWLVYAFMIAGAYKLIARDFANEHNIALVVSLLCYGGALIVLPRILRTQVSERAPNAGGS